MACWTCLPPTPQISDITSNSLRVLKTSKQTNPTPTTYVAVLRVRMHLQSYGCLGLFAGAIHAREGRLLFTAFGLRADTSCRAVPQLPVLLCPVHMCVGLRTKMFDRSDRLKDLSAMTALTVLPYPECTAQYTYCSYMTRLCLSWGVSSLMCGFDKRDLTAPNSVSLCPKT